MAKWIEYTGSDEQIYEIMGSKFGFMTEDHLHIERTADCVIPDVLSIGDKYLICEPHPNADIIEIWARTGCEVYVRVTKIGDKNEFPELAQYIESVEHTETYCTNKPDWNMNAEYRLTPFEDE